MPQAIQAFWKEPPANFNKNNSGAMLLMSLALVCALAFGGLIGGLLIAMAIINKRNSKEPANKVEYTITKIVE